MGFNIADYKEVLTDLDVNKESQWNNADGEAPYVYASGDDEYDYANGAIVCKALHPFNKTKEQECITKKAGSNSKLIEAQANLELARAAALKAGKAEQAPMSPLAITGIIVGSLLAITVMVVVIKKVKANRG